jgi:hypothetical protein
VNRTQLLVGGFLLTVWCLVVAIAVVAPDVFADAMGLARADRLTHFRLLAALSALLIVLGTGVARGWRWTFWLVLVAFGAGILRIPASALQLAGVLPATAPS